MTALLPIWVAPMLAESGRGKPVALEEWALEPKWDGWRCVVCVDEGSVRLTSRWQRDLTWMFPQIAVAPSALATRRVLLDGEVVAVRRDGTQDFHALARRRPRDDVRLVLMAFDLLHLDGRDLTGETYVTRRLALEQLGVNHGHWLTTPSARGDAASALWSFTLANGWEGVVAKRLDSRYRAGTRDGAWLKAKHPHARDLHVDRSAWRSRRAYA